MNYLLLVSTSEPRAALFGPFSAEQMEYHEFCIDTSLPADWLTIRIVGDNLEVTHPFDLEKMQPQPAPPDWDEWE